MKKIIALLAILLASTSLFALDCNLSLGYQEKYTDYHNHDPIYVSINLWQDFNGLRLYSNYTNEMSKSENSVYFSPSQDYFTVGASYSFDCITLSVEHMCQHPVISNYNWSGVQGGYTKVQVTIGKEK